MLTLAQMQDIAQRTQFVFGPLTMSVSVVEYTSKLIEDSVLRFARQAGLPPPVALLRLSVAIGVRNETKYLVVLRSFASDGRTFASFVHALLLREWIDVFEATLNFDTDKEVIVGKETTAFLDRFIAEVPR